MYFSIWIETAVFVFLLHEKRQSETIITDMDREKNLQVLSPFHSSLNWQYAALFNLI